MASEDWDGGEERVHPQRWRRVISDPDHRRLLPRYHLHDAVVGFFDHRSFISFSGRGRFVGPSLPFLPDCGELRLLDICNGLLLCRRRRLSDPRRFDYLVANPATEQWIVLPESGWTHKEQIARLGFDPVVSSSHFHVFEFELVEHSAMGMSGDHDGNVVAVEIYSSETGVWIHRNNGWGCIIRTLDIWRSVFFKGMLHLITMDDVVAVVDVEGNSWRTIPMPETFVDPYYGVDDGFINVSQDCLCFVNTDRDDLYKLLVWVLEDYSSDQWTLKHTVSHLHLFGTDKQHFGYDYKVVSIHPKRNIIFLVSLNDGIFISYEMDSREVHYICELGDILTRHYLPYVPLYSESLANEARREGIPPPDDNLTDDLLVEVLSRVPYKTLCRLKCVCWRWRRVISHPDSDHRLPRYHLHGAIAGFFDHYDVRFADVSTAAGAGAGGRPLFLDPSLHFLPRCRALDLLDSCNGLLLCRCWRISDYRRRFDYLVVNHATRQWVVLPESARSDKRQIAYLGFDPAVSSSHFHAFELVEKNPANADGEADDGELDATIDALEIYSSETGVWSHKDIGWGHQIGVLDDWRSVFFNGMLHLITMGYVVAVVDVEGNSWRTIPMPQTLDDPDCSVDDGFVDLSQGRLYFVNTDRYDLYNSLSVWVLQDYSSDQWTLKHTVSHLHLFGRRRKDFGHDY
uniref:F-box domain-containing protein n=1 Tax=Oryza rufipogon TaxID=4529 RepID=A0A0E0PI70_ORYRU